MVTGSFLQQQKKVIKTQELKTGITEALAVIDWGKVSEF